MFKVPNQYRIKYNHPLSSTDADGNNGCFLIERSIFIIASDGGGWEHVSVSLKKRKENPSWDIMNRIKNMFWEEEDTVFQFHPPKSQYVNFHPYCLHLWRPIGKEIPLPNPKMIA